MLEKGKKVRYYDILNAHPSKLSEKDEELIKKAFVYGAKKHQGQIRLSGEPYFSHPISVAVILSKMNLDSSTIVAGLLHDVIEDAPSSPTELRKIQNEIREMFGESILKIILGVTKISKFHEGMSKEEKVGESYRTMILGMVNDPRIILVKLADRLHNMRTLSFIQNEDKRKRIAKETIEIYAPMAHRLGIGKIKSELEDLSFKYLFQDEYKQIRTKLLDREDELRTILEETKQKLADILKENSIKADIKGRIKKPFSIYQKIKNKGVSIEQIFDLLALRVITRSEKECFDTSTIIKRNWVHIPSRYRDFISKPKPNNYRALHLTIIEKARPIEIQIRSKDMNTVAEKGIAAHYYYKSGKVDDEKIKKSIEYLREVIESKRKTEVIDKLKDELKQEFISVITPKGEFINLHKGYTVLDFAYQIHSKLGNHFKRAIVNGAIVKGNKVLNDGDFIVVETDSKESPKKEWLYFVKSRKARTNIKEHINKIKEGERIELGNKLISLFLSRKKIKTDEFEERLLSSEIFRKHGFKNISDFYKKVGGGEFQIDFTFMDELFPEKKDIQRKRIIPLLPHKNISNSNKNLTISNNDNSIMLAKCCNPIKGEPIIGYITKEGKISAHSQKCRLINSELLKPSRIINLDWDKSFEHISFVSLRIIAVDVLGVLYKISKIFVDEKINISKLVSKKDKEGNALIKLKFGVKDINQYNKIIKALKKLKEIINIERTK
jgi:GTP pyrophosphokinase